MASVLSLLHHSFCTVLMLVVFLFWNLPNANAWIEPSKGIKFLNNVSIVVLNAAAQTNSDSAGTTTKSDGYLTVGGGILKDFEFKSKKFNLQTGVLYHVRKFGVENSFTASTTWIQIPILMKKNLSFFSFGLGAYLDFGLGDATYVTPTGTSNVPLSTVTKSFDTGLAGSVGVRFLKNFFADFKYMMGLANVAPSGVDSMKFHELQLQVGMKF